jgi:predicted thioesterase
VLLGVWALVIAVVFFVGLVVGRALEDAPTPVGTQTLVRTLEPSTVGPSETVTIKVKTSP